MGAVQAYIHVGIGQIGDNREENVGVIRFMGYERGARHVGQAVLEKAEAYLKTYNVSQIFAFSQDCRYRFYHFEHAYLSDVLDQVQALLGFNGYRRSAGEVFLDWENYTVTPMPSSLSVELSVDWEQGRGEHPNCTVRAHRDGEEIGICESVCGGEFSSHPNAQDWLHTVCSVLKTSFRDKVWDAICFNMRFKRCTKSDTSTQRLVLPGITTARSSFIATAVIGLLIGWTYGYEKVLSEPPTHK